MPSEAIPVDPPKFVMFLFLIPFLASLRDSEYNLVRFEFENYLLIPFMESYEADIR